MNWTKIPTDLLKQRIPDNEMISIVKYQLLWADLEYQPDDKTALRYITNKQLAMVKQWLNTIEAQVVADIKTSEVKRNSRKISYRKNKELDKIVDSTVDSTVNTHCTHSDTVDKIRLDKIRKEKENKKEKEPVGNKHIDPRYPPEMANDIKWSHGCVRLTFRDYYAWVDAFPNIDLRRELERRADWYDEQDDSIRKNWFFSTSRYFQKINDERAR